MKAARIDRHSSTVDLIVQFRDGSFSPLDRLRGDLDRIDLAARQRSKIAADSTDRPRIKQRFSRVLNGAGIRVPRELREAVEALPYVASVSVERIFEPLASADEWSAQNVRAWTSNASRGEGVTVAVIDTGIDYRHPALGGGFGPGFKVVQGWDFVDGDADPMDTYGHGTHVAGIIAAEGSGMVGVAPAASLVAYRVLDPISGEGGESSIIAAIERCVDPNQDGDSSDHIDIANISLGALSEIDDDPLVAAIERATAAGVLFCISSGNFGVYGMMPTPAIAPSAITVGAADHKGKTAVFSSRGPTYAYGLKPEVIAPGVDIVSTVLNGAFVAASGTSMAAPHVAGVAAIVKSLHRDWSPRDVKARVINTAVAVDEDVMAAGAGRADASQAAAATTLATPGVVDFGQVDTKQDTWRVARTYTLKNVSNETQSLVATVEGLREGVDIKIIPSSVTLAAGESKTVTAEIAASRNVPAPGSGSLSYGGRIVWSGGAMPIHLPWAFVKAAVLTIDAPGAEDGIAHIIGDTFRFNLLVGFSGRTRMMWPLGKVDVAVRRLEYPEEIAIVEQVEVDGAPVAHVDIGAAKFSVAADTTDEQGGALHTSGRDCFEQVVLSFPQGGKIVASNNPNDGARTRFSAFSSRIKTYILDHCADRTGSTVYAALHQPIEGLEANVTSTLRPQWFRQDFEFVPDIPRISGMTGITPSMRFPGAEHQYLLSGGSAYLLRETPSNITMLFTRSPGPEVDLFTYLDRWGKCFNEELGHDVDCPVIDTIYLYLNEQNVKSDSGIYLDVSPMAYQVPRGNLMRFEPSPLSAQVGLSVGFDWWVAQAIWYGPLGERRIRETVPAKLVIYDVTGAIVASGANTTWRLEALTPGRYRIESEVSEMITSGAVGKATYVGSVDTTKSDAMLPLFTGARIVDGQERLTTQVESGGAASLLFAVADLAPGEIFSQRVPPREELTRVEYRQHGTGEWRTLTPVATARQYQNNSFLFAGVGTMFRVDLSPVTREIRGHVDLRMRAEDSAGNAIELRLEPAFLVGSTRRQRAIRQP